MTGMYCSLDQLKNTTGTALSDTILTEIITQAGREVDAYLLMRDLSGSGDPTVVAATLKFAAAGVVRYNWNTGDAPKLLQAGNFRLQADPEEAIRLLEEEGYRLLTQYVDQQIIRTEIRQKWVMRTN